MSAKQVEILAKENEHLKRLLSEVEWVATPEGFECAFCGAKRKMGHRSMCRLFHALQGGGAPR